MQKLLSIIFNNVMHIMSNVTCKKTMLKKKLNHYITHVENKSISQKLPTLIFVPMQMSHFLSQHVKPQHFKLDLIA